VKRAFSLILIVLGLPLGCTKSSDPAPSASAVPPSASVAGSAAPRASSSPSAQETAKKTDDPFAALTDGPVVREQVTVTIDGAKETWRLEWKRPPVPDCVGPGWDTCPCAGFAFGEKGDMDLVRARPGAKEERLALGPLFEGKDVRLRRWTPVKSDTGKAPDIGDLVVRPVGELMKLGDYDHDGRATELVLQVDAGPCGHAPAIVVGISKKNPTLHAFGTKDKPNEPLTLPRPDEWEKLKAKPAVDFVTLPCGDHGAEEEVSLHVIADGELTAKESKRTCR
jgi:hypothetical protein